MKHADGISDRGGLPTKANRVIPAPRSSRSLTGLVRKEKNPPSVLAPEEEFLAFGS